MAMIERMLKKLMNIWNIKEAFLYLVSLISYIIIPYYDIKSIIKMEEWYYHSFALIL